MTITALTQPPNRIRDLISLRQLGYDLTLDIRFEIIPVNFAQKDISYQAYIFICRFEGTMDDTPFGFRKCYAKGCPHNLCPHVAQAVMIANRYLARDYKRLRQAGIVPKEKFFRLEEMITGFDQAHARAAKEAAGGILTIHDFIRMAHEGQSIQVEVGVELISGVEHFGSQDIQQCFLMADFDITAFGAQSRFQRCVACYLSPEEEIEKPIAITTANDRLKLLYAEFEAAGIQYIPRFF